MKDDYWINAPILTTRTNENTFGMKFTWDWCIRDQNIDKKKKPAIYKTVDCCLICVYWIDVLLFNRASHCSKYYSLLEYKICDDFKRVVLHNELRLEW